MVSIRGLSAAALLTWATAVKAYCPSAEICGTVIPSKDSDDVYVQITAPEDAGWAGFGFGSRMKGALIFVIYPNAKGTNVTLSPRIGEGNVEPQYEDSIDYEILGGTGIADGKWTMNFVCHNCREWDGGQLDVSSSEELFIFARGGDETISSDEPDASLYQHQAARGNFPLDLAGATVKVQGNPFLGGNSNTNGDDDTDNGTDTDTDIDTDGNNDSDADADNNIDTDNDDSGKEDSGSSAPMTKADKTLLAHGMAFVVASGFVARFLL